MQPYHGRPQGLAALGTFMGARQGPNLTDRYYRTLATAEQASMQAHSPLRLLEESAARPARPVLAHRGQGTN